MTGDARFCVECGIAIEPQALAALPTGARCPRCSSSLRFRMLDEGALIECGACQGVWLDAPTFERFCEKAAARPPEPPPLRSRWPDPYPVRYLPCVICGQFMTRRQHPLGSGIIVDLCRGHGVWLDSGEMERLVSALSRKPIV
jgi:Zn-finger nucleic acid-binding protein